MVLFSTVNPTLIVIVGGGAEAVEASKKYGRRCREHCQWIDQCGHCYGGLSSRRSQIRIGPIGEGGFPPSNAEGRDATPVPSAAAAIDGK